MSLYDRKVNDIIFSLLFPTKQEYAICYYF